MKITKDSRVPNIREERKKKANSGCNICPCCGESKYFYVDRTDGEMKGLSGPAMYKTFTTGFFKIKTMRIDCYSCFTCGAGWESEPYELS